MVPLLLALFFRGLLNIDFRLIEKILGDWGSLAFIPFVLWYYLLTAKDIHITLNKTV